MEVTLKSTRQEVVKPFIFLNFRLKENSFREVVNDHWNADFEGDPFNLFHYKLKRVKKVLKQLSRTTFGNIF